MAKVKTAQVAEWERRYHSTDPKEQSFGGKLIITLNDGTVVSDEKACANAHPLGKTPWKRPNYIKKLEQLTKGLVSDVERKAFLDSVDKLEKLKGIDLCSLTPTFDVAKLEAPTARGIYNASGCGKKESCAA